MSNRDSLGFGDLLPQDVVEVFAQERHSKRGRKKRSNSLGRALGWLKGKKRKDLGANGQNLGLGPALDLALDGHTVGYQVGSKGGQKLGKQNHPYGNTQAAPKRNEDDKAVAPPLLQENVFIETSRPKYLEDLHTEALEGLKMMQQEEINNGVEFQDNESTISTMTAQTDGESGGFTTDSTIPDTSSVVSVQSSVSTRSSRSGLTRQGSTFRPLNSGKKSDKIKRGRHRKTVGGIPQHVRREMGLDRVDWTLTQNYDEEQLYNGETDTGTSSDGPQETAGSPGTTVLPDIKIIQPLSKDQVEQLGASHAGHRDDLALLHCLGSGASDEQRPRSLAVPCMTTANGLQQEQPGPVMSMSPQAAYMSKIIPNAVLPPSIEVVEISRGRSRSSVRTVSKSSLLLSSPASSRASSRASSSRTTSSRASTITSASRYNPLHLSDSSCWTTSESSDTLVSDSSTISSSTTARQKKSQDGDASAMEDQVSIHSSISKASKCTSNGKVLGKFDETKRDGQFVRSLSVMKPKRAPPPPNRSYSLHNKKRRSRDLHDIRVISGESSPKKISREENKNKPQYSPVTKIDSPSYHADTSSLDDSAGSGSFSPFKSQLQALKEEKAAKFEKTANKDASQEKKGNKLSKVISPSSGYSSQDAVSPHCSSPRPKKGFLAKLQRLLPLPNSAGSAVSSDKTKAGNDSVDSVTVSPSVRALRDLFNIPPPPKVHAPPPPPPEVWAHSKRSVELLLGPPVPENLYAIIKKNPKDRRQQRQSPSASTERKQKAVEAANGSVCVLEMKTVQESRMMKSEMSKENDERLAQKVDLKENVTEKEKVSDKLNGMLIKAVGQREERLIAVRDDAKKTSTQATDALAAISLVHISQSPSPSAVRHPLQSPQVNVASGQAIVSPEASWPPPPPPSASHVGIGGPEDVDFPLPPPPLFSAVGLVLPVQVPSSSSQGSAQPTLAIPPPPPYSAPPPPLKEASPSRTIKISLPSKEAFPPPPKEFAPPPLTKVFPQPPKEFVPSPSATPPPATTVVSPPPATTVVSPPPPPPASTVVSPPPPPKASTVVSPPPPPPASTVVSPPPATTVVSPPPPPPASTVVSPPPPPPASTVVSPPPASTVVSPPPASTVVSPPPASTVVSPPPASTVVSPPPASTVVSPPPASTVVSPPPPPPATTVVSPPPPPPATTVVSPPPASTVVSPPPPPPASSVVSTPPPPPASAEVPPQASSEVASVRPKESYLQVQEVKDISNTPIKVVSPSPVQAVSPLPPKEISIEPSVDATLVGILTPPSTIPPPPPLPSQPPSSDMDNYTLQENSQSKPETSSVSYNGIPPPPSIELLHQPQFVPLNTDSPATQEAAPSDVSIQPSPEISPSPEKAQEPAPPPPLPLNTPLPPSLPVQSLARITHQPSSANTENQNQEMASVTNTAQKEEPVPIVTPSLLQMVKLRSVNNSPEPPKAPDPPQSEITGREVPNNDVPSSSANGETPQKPIRKSLVMTSSTSASPPVITASQSALPKSQSLVVPPASSATAFSPTRKSPTTTGFPSMNLQEAIRLRTASRSREAPASRLSVPSPTSPLDPLKSPSSTASFIFSKNYKKVVLENKPTSEAKAAVPKNQDVPSVPKVANEAESLKTEVKVPPPVAKKPKARGKENETSEEMEQTAGEQENNNDAAERRNGTAGTVGGGEAALT